MSPVPIVGSLLARRRLRSARRTADQPGAAAPAVLTGTARALLTGPVGWTRAVWPRVEVAALNLLVQDHDPRAVSGLLADLADHELVAWHRQLDRVDRATHDELLAAVGERVSLTAWRRFGRFTDDIDPTPVGDLADRARAGTDQDGGTPALWSWSAAPGPFSAVGDGDGHALAANDVRQGRIGNCYLIAALQAIADVAPHRLTQLCAANGNGTWTVTFPDGRRTVVSPDVVVDVHGVPVFARLPDGGEQELWPLLLEKAYAQRHRGWAAIVDGHAEDAVEELTGVAGHVVTGEQLDVAYIDRWRVAGAAMVLSTGAVPAGTDLATWRAEHSVGAFRHGDDALAQLHPQHAFVVVGVDTDAGTVTVANPWDVVAGRVTVTDEELAHAFAALHVTDLRAG